MSHTPVAASVQCRIPNVKTISAFQSSLDRSKNKNPIRNSEDRPSRAIGAGTAGFGQLEHRSERRGWAHSRPAGYGRTGTRLAGQLRGKADLSTRLSEQIFRGMAPWVNWLPGRLLHVVVLACGVFGSVSGSSAATCATISKIALPELKRRGYSESLTIGSLCAGGTLGILIPPSIIMVLYAVAAEVSLIKLMIAGFLPGFLMMGLFSAYIIVWSLLPRHRTPGPGETLPLRERFALLLELGPLAALLVFVFGALFAGWITATECAAWGVLGSILVALQSRAFS